MDNDGWMIIEDMFDYDDDGWMNVGQVWLS